MGEALAISRAHMLRLAEEAEVPQDIAGMMIDDICEVASRFATIAATMELQVITQDTLRTIQLRIDENVAQLRQAHGSLHRH